MIVVKLVVMIDILDELKFLGMFMVIVIVGLMIYVLVVFLIIFFVIICKNLYRFMKGLCEVMVIVFGIDLR